VQLNELIDLQVETEPHQIKEKVLKSRSLIENQIKDESARLERASLRVSELKTLIKESEDLIESWSMRVMKLRRAPEDIPDKKTREAWKYEERKKIEKYEEEKLRLQKYSKDTKLPELQKRLSEWGSSPDDYEIAPTKVIEVPVTLRERFRAHEDDDFSLDKYSELMGLDAGTWAIHDKPTWAKIRRFENEILLQAIGWRLVRPTKQAALRYPELNKYVDDKSRDDEVESDDGPMNALIIKTGGAEIGATIYNGGTTWDGKPRAFGNFDNVLAYKKKDTGESGGQLPPPGEFFGNVDSGDFAERSEE